METELNIILEAVSNHFKIDKIKVFDKSKEKRLVLIRQFFYYLARKLNPETIVSSRYIGAYYSDITGNVYDHSTVLYSCKKIKGYIESYRSFAETERELLTKIKNNVYNDLMAIDVLMNMENIVNN